MSKFCGNCGNALVEGARACGNCGAFVDGSVNAYADNNNQGVNTNDNVNTNNTSSNKKSDIDYGTIGFIVSLISQICCCGYFNFISFILCLIGIIDSKKNTNINKNLAIAGLIISCAGYILLIFSASIRAFFSLF